MYRLNPEAVLDDVLVGLSYGFDTIKGIQRLTSPAVSWDYSQLYRYLVTRFVANQSAFPDPLPYQERLGDYGDAD